MAKVVLSDGKEVEISSVSFNKEQRINVTKTYITTVKKAVVKVCRDFYSFDIPTLKLEVEEVPVVNDLLVPQPVEKTESVLEMPAVEENVKPNEPTEPVINNDVVMESFANGVAPVAAAPVAPVAAAPTAVASVIPEPAVSLSNPEPVAANPVVTEIPSVVPEAGAVSFNIPVEEPKPAPVTQPQEVVAPVVNPVPTVNEAAPVVNNTTPVEPPVAEAPQSFFDAQPLQTNSELVFDASNETNFNNAMNQGNGDVAVAAGNLDSLRAFGVDGGTTPPVADNATVQPVETSVEAKPEVKTKVLSKGFANSKIVAVIGVILFVLACIFMGYEIFNYVNIVK